MNQGFIADSTGSEGMACKISQFVTQQLIMAAGKDMTIIKRAGKDMVH